jgi:hypothetical protein
MASTRTHQRRATTSQTARVNRQAQPGRRFTRSRRRQPEPGGAEKLIGLVRGALPGGRSPAKGKAGAIPVVGGLLGGKKRASAGRGRKPALLGLLGAGAAGAAMAAKRRKGSDSGRANEIQPAPEPNTVAPSNEDPPSRSAD